MPPACAPIADSPSAHSVATFNSLDLDQSFADIHDPSLLTESLSFDSLSVISSDAAVPPFPLGCMIPMSNILSAKPRQLCDTSATITVPTPPRLRTLSKENISVKTWTENLAVDDDAPGHTPWGDLEIDEGLPWIAEGSLYSPEQFKTSLTSTRRAVICSQLSEEEPESPVRTRRSTNSHRRDALVFEREITLKSDCGLKRWSVQVPASIMDPETVDFMLQLRDINNYLLDSTNTIPENIIEVEKEEPNIPPPSLMISTSQFTMPLSLDSAGNLETKNIPSTTSLATRRQRTLPPLTISEPKLTDIIYPGIPTAFLGSTPPASLPTPTGIKLPSMSLEDMIGNLRSRCASLQVSTPASADLFSVQQQETSNIELKQRDGNEWKFTEKLIQSFVPETSMPLDTTEAANISFTDLLNDSLLNETLVASPVLDTSMDSVRPVLISLKPPLDSDYLPPSSPLPPCPTQPNSPRGILKRCKSVRFASENEEVEVTAEIVKVAPSQRPPRHSTGSSAPPAKRPPAIRHTYAPKCIVIPPQNMLPSKSQPGFLSAAGRKKPGGGPIHAALISPSRAPSTPPADRRHSIAVRSRSPTKSSAARSAQFIQASQTPSSEHRPSLPVRHSLLPTSPQKTRPSITARQSFAPPVTDLQTEKENSTKIMGRVTALKPRNTHDENALRRGKPEKDTPRSRVPMPLRNILTRFK